MTWHGPTEQPPKLAAIPLSTGPSFLLSETSHCCPNTKAKGPSTESCHFCDLWRSCCSWGSASLDQGRLRTAASCLWVPFNHSFHVLPLSSLSSVVHPQLWGSSMAFWCTPCWLPAAAWRQHAEVKKRESAAPLALLFIRGTCRGKKSKPVCRWMSERLHSIPLLFAAIAGQPPGFQELSLGRVGSCCFCHGQLMWGADGVGLWAGSPSPPQPPQQEGAIGRLLAACCAPGDCVSCELLSSAASEEGRGGLRHWGGSEQQGKSSCWALRVEGGS